MTGTRHAPPLFVGVRCMGAAVKTSGMWLAALCSGVVAVAMLIAVALPWGGVPQAMAEKPQASCRQSDSRAVQQLEQQRAAHGCRGLRFDVPPRHRFQGAWRGWPRFEYRLDQDRQRRRRRVGIGATQPLTTSPWRTAA